MKCKRHVCETKHSRHMHSGMHRGVKYATTGDQALPHTSPVPKVSQLPPKKEPPATKTRGAQTRSTRSCPVKSINATGRSVTERRRMRPTQTGPHTKDVGNNGKQQSRNDRYTIVILCFALTVIVIVLGNTLTGYLHEWWPLPIEN